MLSKYLMEALLISWKKDTCVWLLPHLSLVMLCTADRNSWNSESVSHER